MTGIHRIDSISGRKKLALRREPYWHRVAPGQALGYRVLSSGAGTWVARWTNPDDSTQKNTHALGAFTDYSESERFDKARAAAVVPFGLVTFSRNVVALLPDSLSKVAAPTMV